MREERKGPRVGAPEGAVQGFLKSAGLASLDEAKIVSDPKKGEFYVAVIERPGRETIEVLAEIIPAIVKSFPWPKSMRWGAASREPGSLRWVRPLHSIVASFGPETETPELVPFAIEGVEVGFTTRGHRFLAPQAIEVRRFADYLPALERAFVVLDADRRKDIILHDARDLAFARGLDLVEDEGLLEEVAGLVEWPVTLMGAFDERFLKIPPEVIRATIRANQKCFVLRGAPGPDGRERLANAFILVSNLVASDGGAAIVAGNERVVRARLSDAAFFWETDRKVRLEDRLVKLDNIVFHEKLGTQGARVERIAALARALAPSVGADPALAERAARLAKADLVTEMVGEFPELQGLMGRYYAAEQARTRRSPRRSRTITSRSAPATGCRPSRSRWRWRSPTSSTPWSASGRSTRSRRGARTPTRCGARRSASSASSSPARRGCPCGRRSPRRRRPRPGLGRLRGRPAGFLRRPAEGLPARPGRPPRPHRRRLRPARPGRPADGGAPGRGARPLPRHRGRQEPARRLPPRRQHPAHRGEEGRPRLRRGARPGPPDPARGDGPAEALRNAGAEAGRAVAGEDFEGAMRALSSLRAPVDAFFDKVTVNADDAPLRANRLALLHALRAATGDVADFSRIGGEGR